ncbi:MULTISPECIES: nicotinate-nucleotide--dimethylbenzimidazole phosphoribosyltransferase [Desulfitobacterium]|uniref:Nicotinate-nucleotide--dimethylbenzimidazole phosphoribosyltransferase n=1 Tax=Desulfitobacterium dehalogenans (strain ATCC 51507 / DSM 9161 / JW/IU-DC1) TaxID=756499 RepID=I4AAS9_DESDJ|nr:MULTISPECIES: nicotinate-nucleotide--dimethylbenzimidazole phosphoribosyltransferase [Desulfitobacterium]AFM01064.1 nicotinate-nucleotide-dimethylbenzimidazole phosphoribosyltransferase [Desulfitobacterium dehalogenans ATCC 51507]
MSKTELEQDKLWDDFFKQENLGAASLEECEAALNHLIQGIRGLDEQAMEAVQARLDSLTKPQGSLGVLETIAKQLGGIQGQPWPEVEKKAILVMAGDHGVVAEGVSAFPQEVTPQMFYNFLSGGAGINVLARHANADVICTDVGMAFPLDPPELMVHRIMNGTHNMALGPAMSRKEALLSLLTGAKIARQAIDSGVNVLATGEVGIGNTTPSAAIISLITGLPPQEVTGRGTGLDDAGLIRKQEVIARSIEINQPDPQDGMDVLSKIGGLEIGALAGAILQAAFSRVPILLDGVISTAAALIATRLCPTARFFLIPSHSSVEIGHITALKELDLKPIMHLDFRLGEGTGAAIGFHLLDASIRILNEMATFESAGVSSKN